MSSFETFDSEKIKFLMNRMKEKTPSVFQRLIFNFLNFFSCFIFTYKDDDNESAINIDIFRQKNLTKDMILKFNNSVNLDDDQENQLKLCKKDLTDLDFKNHCLEACLLCKNVVLKFKLLNIFAKLANFCVLGILPVFAEYHLNIEYSIAVSLFGGFIFCLDSISDWSKLIEKYSHIHSEFYELIYLKSENRIQMFEFLVLKYESNFLFIDSFNKIKALDFRNLK